jgi:hypothetical protein
LPQWQLRLVIPVFAEPLTMPSPRVLYQSQDCAIALCDECNAEVRELESCVSVLRVGLRTGSKN